MTIQQISLRTGYTELEVSELIRSGMKKLRNYYRAHPEIASDVLRHLRLLTETYQISIPRREFPVE